MAKKGSACAKLIIFGASNSGMYKCVTEAGDQSIQAKDRKCDKSSLGATWITGTCASGTTYKLSLWEVCVTKASGRRLNQNQGQNQGQSQGQGQATTAAPSSPTEQCYDFDDTSQATITNALSGAGESVKADMQQASKAIIAALVVSFILLLWGCAVIVNDDLNLSLCNRMFFTVLGLALMACQAFAIHLVKKGLDTGACSAETLGDGGAATAASLGLTALVVLITFPLDCGPCGACIEGGGSSGSGGDGAEEEGEGSDSSGAAAAACCLLACIKTVFCVWLTFATEKVAQVVGVAYTVTRTVASKLSTLVCPILCLPLFLCAKLTPKKHHPTKCAKRLSLLSCWVSLGLVIAAFFASEKGTTNYAPQPDAGWFGTPIVKAECYGRVLIGTIFEACWADGQNSNGVICKDYADDIVGRTNDYNTYFKGNKIAEVLGKDGLRLAIAIIVLQLVMTVSVTSMFFCVLMRNLPGPGYFVGVVGGLSSTLQIAFLAIVHQDLIASTSAYDCGGSASPSPSDGMVFLSISCVLNIIVAIMLFGPFLKFIFSCCPCCKDGGPCDCCDAEDEDAEDAETGDEVAPPSKKHVV